MLLWTNSYKSYSNIQDALLPRKPGNNRGFNEISGNFAFSLVSTSGFSKILVQEAKDNMNLTRVLPVKAPLPLVKSQSQLKNREVF